MKKWFLKHLKDNSGEVNMEKMIIISIFFIIGALLISAVVIAISNNYEGGLKGLLDDIMH